MGQADSVADLPGHAPEPRLRDPCSERGAARALLHDGKGRDDALDVFVAGTVFMDMIFTGLPGLPPPGTELITDGLGSAPGGIANIAVAMSRLGLEVGLAAAFGDDMFGAYLWRTLSEQEGVDLSRSRRVPGWSTPVTVSLAYDADRSMVTYHRPMPLLPDQLVDDPPKARTCFIELDHPVPTWAETLRRGGCTVVADVGWDATETWSTDVLDRLCEVDLFLPNAVEAMAYTRADSPERALDVLAERVPVVVVKRGAQGAIAVDSTTGEREAAPVARAEPTVREAW